MVFLVKTKNCLLVTLTCILCCTACAKTAPEPAPAAVPVASVAPAQDCEGFSELVKMANSQDMLTLAPDAFIEKYKHLISVTSDKSETIAAPNIERYLTFKAVKGDWLAKANATYTDDDAEGPHKSLLTEAGFTIPLTCLPTVKQLDTLLSQPEPTEKQLSADSKMAIYWSWMNPEPNDTNSQTYTNFTLYPTEARLGVGRETIPSNED